MSDLLPAHVVRPTVVTLLASAAALAVGVTVAGKSDWWLAFAAAFVAAGLATVVTLPMLVSALRLPPTLAGPRVLAVGMLRAMVTLGVTVAAIALLQTPTRPTALMAMLLYGAVLVAETWTASRVVSTAPAAEPSTSPDPQAKSTQ